MDTNCVIQIAFPSVYCLVRTQGNISHQNDKLNIAGVISLYIQTIMTD